MPSLSPSPSLSPNLKTKMPYGVSNSFKRELKTYSHRRNRTNNARPWTMFAEENNASTPPTRIVYRMSATGHVVKETLYPDHLSSHSNLDQPEHSYEHSASRSSPEPRGKGFTGNETDTRLPPPKKSTSTSTQAASYHTTTLGGEPPSSPLSSASNPFSDSEDEPIHLAAAPADILSPPSSPPPAQRSQQQTQQEHQEEKDSIKLQPSAQVPAPPSASLKARKPTFSFLSRKRKRTLVDDSHGASSDDDSDTENKTSRPLTEIQHNVKTVRWFLPSSHPPKEQQQRDQRKTKEKPAMSKKPRLTQLRLDLGGEIQRKCKECEMEYVPSHEEDEALHKAFHGMNIGGVDMGRGFAREMKEKEEEGFLENVGSVGEGREGGFVVAVDGRSRVGVRRRAEKVLEVVKTDLGSVEISRERLWAGNGRKREKERDGKVGEEKEGKEGTEGAGTKVFLYLDGDKCVGLCLAEEILSASKVVVDGNKNGQDSGNTNHRKSGVMTEPSDAKMLLGISRIWVSKSHRRKGIATRLLDSARAHFFYGFQVPKSMVAFSQPTESGTQLAERWFGVLQLEMGTDNAGKGDGCWHVYAEPEWLLDGRNFNEDR